MSVEIDLSLPARSEFCAVSRHNESFGSRARWTPFAGPCAVSIGLALTFAALEVEADARNGVARLVLRHRGESLPFGEGLPAHERATIARELRRALAAGNAR